MKLKIKIKSPYQINVTDKGDWFDLRYLGPDIVMPGIITHKMDYIDENGKKRYRKMIQMKPQAIELNVAMQLPKGFEAIVASRSSTPKNFGFICANGIGIIDNTYCGNNDTWKFIALPFESNQVRSGDRIAQFRIQLSQKATILQKLKWLFSNGIEFQYVDNLENEDRGGIGSTGK